MPAHAVMLAAGAAIVFVLGTLHLVFTFFTPRFDPRDAELKARMQQVSPVLTRQTTMWRAWVGFNASHSLGAMLFGAVYAHLALAWPQVLFASPVLLALGLAMLLALLALARAYWFRIPLRGLALATLLYVLGWVLAA